MTWKFKIFMKSLQISSPPHQLKTKWAFIIQLILWCLYIALFQPIRDPKIFLVNFYFHARNVRQIKSEKLIDWKTTNQRGISFCSFCSFCCFVVEARVKTCKLAITASQSDTGVGIKDQMIFEWSLCGFLINKMPFAKTLIINWGGGNSSSEGVFWIIGSIVYFKGILCYYNNVVIPYNSCTSQTNQY